MPDPRSSLVRLASNFRDVRTEFVRTACATPFGIVGLCPFRLFPLVALKPEKLSFNPFTPVPAR